MVLHVTKKEFDELLAGDLPVFADFFATWCGPCKMFAPILEAVSEEEEFKDKIVFCKVDVDEEEDLANRYQIMAVPTLMLFKNGEIDKKQPGGLSASGLREFLK